MRKILIVDDHKLIFDGLEKTLKNFKLDYASTTEEAHNQLCIEGYFAVILDISLGENKGFDIINSIPKSTYTFFLSMHKSSIYIQMAIDFGANGYFLKDESMDQLLLALNKPMNKSFWMSSAVEHELKAARVYESTNYDKLSPREQQIFAMLAEDLSYKEIASRLKLSTKTVNNHRAHLMKKLGIETQTALVLEATRLGIISV